MPTTSAEQTSNLPATLIKGKLDLTTVNGNAYAVLGAVERALKKAGNSKADIAAVLAAMKTGNYDHLLAVAVGATEWDY